ncbi:MAG: crotonase [Gammaproteobacteria bacterium]|nr:MAG: crotonase [Gammaproteobacteria bacterium]
MAAKKRLRHWRLQRDEAGTAWLDFDQAESGVNTLNEETLSELDGILTDLEVAPPKALVIRSAKKSGFIFGADVRQFAEFQDEGQALAAIRRGQGILDRIAQLPVCTVAVIQGQCLGGGLELALACRYRLVENEARLGLPEVKLGIYPGFGGSVRLPRLIGAPKAFDLMLTGRTIDGRRAARLGVADYALPERQLENGIRGLLRESPPTRRAGFWLRTLELAPMRFLLAAFLKRQLEKRISAAHYPAPFALIGSWRRVGGANIPRQLETEAESVARLITGPSSRGLVRCFMLRERLRTLSKLPDCPKPTHIHVVGAGVMGGDIAAWCALKGFRVSLQDPRPEAVAGALKRAHRLYRRRLKRTHKVTAAMDRLIPDAQGHGLARADVVIEAIVEDLEAKRGLFRDLEARCKAETLLTTNTSSIPLEQIAETMANPARLVGVHFFNPVAKMPLVEIVAGRQSGKHWLDRACAFAGDLDRLPLPVKSAPGFLVNRALMPYLLEAVTLVDEGVPVEVVDRAATDFGMPMGPVLLADTVGLDICLSVARILAESLGNEVPDTLQTMVEQGRLGKKSGGGFYDHGGKRPKPMTPAPEDLSGIDVDAARDRLTHRLFNEIAACIAEGVVADEELADAGMVFGTGFAPFTGGPCQFMAARGQDRIVARLKELEAKHGRRFAPVDALGPAD